MRSPPAARRHEEQGEHESTGRLVEADGESEDVAVASMTDEEGVWIRLAKFQGVSYSALIALCTRTLGRYSHSAD